MAGLDPAIHDLLMCDAGKTWMLATSAGMTAEKVIRPHQKLHQRA
jgi:hypothetical protein